MSQPRRILVVEDDPEMRHLLAVVLGGEEREVVLAASAEEARAALASSPFHLVLLDLILPDVDGRSLISEIRARPDAARVPIVVISARSGSEIREDCYDLGADFYLEKPFDPAVVERDVASRLARSAEISDGSTDHVTGLLDRVGLSTAVEEADTAYAVASLAVDGFVDATERWGWDEAEAALRAVAEAIRSSVGRDVPFARLGGAEFALLVPEADLDDVEELAGRAADAVRALTLPDTDVRFTASVGVAIAEPGLDFEEAFHVARRRLFLARDAGGNRILFEDVLPGDRPRRVLVAEDDEISATILLHRLKKEGLEITRFVNGREAYDHALVDTPDLVILDVKMPGMDGFEVLERLRSEIRYQTIPIILLTSMGSEADVVRGFQLGADDYILKPFSPVELSARVGRLLRRGRSVTAV